MHSSASGWVTRMLRSTAWLIRFGRDRS
jgi:hypothetical protein